MGKRLKIQITTGDTRPIFKQIVDGVRSQILRGELPNATKLPSVRALAMQLTVNANTVAKAYTMLTTEGLLESRPGLGLFVASSNQPDSRPLFKQIVDDIRMQIARGELPAGTKLPSVREQAMRLAINANTVAKAYTQLTAQGLVDARAGLGLFVAHPRQLLSKAEQARKLEIAIESFVNDIAYLEFSEGEIVRELELALTKIKQLKGNTRHAS